VPPILARAPHDAISGRPLIYQPGGGGVGDGDLEVEFLLEPHERDHDFGLLPDAGLLHFGAISKPTADSQAGDASLRK
jgi:hypothetical protein